MENDWMRPHKFKGSLTLDYSGVDIGEGVLIALSDMGRTAHTEEEIRTVEGHISSIFTEGRDQPFFQMLREVLLTGEGHDIISEYTDIREALDKLLMYGRKPVPTVDALIPYPPNLPEGLLLIRRGNEPFKDSYALPGGFVEYGETLEEGIIREVLEECGISTEVVGLIGVYSDPKRDPRGHSITTAFELKATSESPVAGDDACAVELVPFEKLESIEMAFDHKKIVEDYLGR